MKINYIAIAILIVAITTTKGFGQSNSTRTVSEAEAKKNQAANDEFLRALQTGDVSKLGDIAGPDFVNHGVGEKVGPDSLKASIQTFYARFKPTKVEVKTRVMNGEYFGDWIKYTGANPGMVIEGIEMTRYSNGKAVEHWFFPGGQPRRRPQ
ncbi:MAG TPA: nuclear transport factor 2 family protein [Mucilaginibacter sp.]|jgi:hypothetical protein